MKRLNFNSRLPANRIVENPSTMTQPSSSNDSAGGGRARGHWEALHRDELVDQVSQLHRAAGPKQWRPAQRVGLWSIVVEIWREWADRRRYFAVRLRRPWGKEKVVRPR